MNFSKRLKELSGVLKEQEMDIDQTLDYSKFLNYKKNKKPYDKNIADGLEIMRLYRCPVCGVKKGTEHTSDCKFSSRGIWDGGYKVKVKINGEIVDDWWTWKKSIVNQIVDNLKEYSETKHINHIAIARSLKDVTSAEWNEYEDPIDLTFQHILDYMTND